MKMIKSQPITATTTDLGIWLSEASGGKLVLHLR